MAGVRLEFAQFGKFDSFNIYRNQTSTSVDSLGIPITNISTMYFEDFSVEPDNNYYYRVGAIRDQVEVVSDEIIVDTTTGLWFGNIKVMFDLTRAASNFNTFESSATRSNMGASLGGSYKWLGGALAPNGKIYCVPVHAEDILIIDPSTNTATRSTLGASLAGSENWQGGVLAPNGKIYCAPANAADILIIDKNPSVPALGKKVCLSPHLNKL